MKQRHLVVMLKDPRPGQVKTRLAADIGSIAACWWFRHQTRRLLGRLQDPRWRLVLAVSPDRAVTSRTWPAYLPRIAQGRGDLGARMRRALVAMPRGPVCVIGGDIPAVSKAHIARGFHLLGSHDAVLGPSHDGGYWLVGLRRTRPVPLGLFDGVRWSTEHALADTLAGMSGLSVGFAERLWDVDTGADLDTANDSAGKT